MNVRPAGCGLSEDHEIYAIGQNELIGQIEWPQTLPSIVSKK